MFRQIILLILVLSFSQCEVKKPPTFSYATPESKGYSSEKLDLLRNHLEASGSSSMMIMVNEEVIFEWGSFDKKHLIHSMRKALLNSLYGIAIQRGQIDTAMTLRELNIDDISPALSDMEKEARVADLLKSRSGIYHDAAAVNNAMLKDRPERESHEPGTHYYYNNWDFNAVGAILEQQTGESIYDLFLKEIAGPIGMQDFKGKHVTIEVDTTELEIPDTDGFYQYERSESKFPAYHFRMSTRDLMLYGQLYLRHGEWDGKQLIPKDWIDVSTKPYSIYSPQYGNGYGILWRARVPDENTVRNSFFHTGLGVHMLGVYPDSKLVFVHRVDTESDTDYKEGDFYKMLSLLFNSKDIN